MYSVNDRPSYSCRWLMFDGDISWSRARFTDVDSIGDAIPGSVAAVVSAGATFDGVSQLFGSVRLRYFSPRPLIDDNSVRSRGPSLVNIEAGYRLSKRARLALDVFNLLDATDSDVD